MSYCVCVEPARDEVDLRKKLIARRLTAEGNFKTNPHMFSNEREALERIDKHL